MAAKLKNHRQTGTSDMHKPLTAMADQARTNYEHAVRSGQKFQEEAGQWWTRTLSQAMTGNDWQKQFTRLTAMTTGVMPLAQSRLEEVMQFMETNSRTGAELMKKAVDAAQTSSITESQAKGMDFWSSSMKAVQSNIEAATELSTRAIDSWIQFVKKNTEVTDMRLPKAV